MRLVLMRPKENHHDQKSGTHRRVAVWHPAYLPVGIRLGDTMTNDHLHPKLQRTLDDLLRWGKVDDWIDAIEQLTPEQLAQLERNER